MRWLAPAILAGLAAGAGCKGDQAEAGPQVAPAPALTGEPSAAPSVASAPTGEPSVASVPTGEPSAAPVPTGEPSAAPVPTGEPSSAPAPTGEPSAAPAPAPGEVPESEQNFPLRDWMKANLARPAKTEDFAALERGLTMLVGFAPAEFADWRDIAKRGVLAATAKDADGVRATCTDCHEKIRKEYRKQMRTRPLPEMESTR